MNKNVVPAVVNSEKEVSKNKRRRRKNLYKNDVLFHSWGWIVPCC
jgi:hypothetical protein